MDLLDPILISAIHSSLGDSYAMNVRFLEDGNPPECPKLEISDVSEGIIYVSFLENLVSSPGVNNLVLEMPDPGTEDGTMSIEIEFYNGGSKREGDAVGQGLIDAALVPPVFRFVEWRRDEMLDRLEELERKDPDIEMFRDRNRWKADKSNIVRLSRFINNMRKTMNVLSASVSFKRSELEIRGRYSTEHVPDTRRSCYYEISFDRLDKMSYDFIEFLSRDDQLGPHLLDVRFTNEGLLTRRVTFILASTDPIPRSIPRRDGSRRGMIPEPRPPLVADRLQKKNSRKTVPDVDSSSTVFRKRTKRI